jgi:hypothetical protein
MTKQDRWELAVRLRTYAKFLEKVNREGYIPPRTDLQAAMDIRIASYELTKPDLVFKEE